MRFRIWKGRQRLRWCVTELLDSGSTYEGFPSIIGRRPCDLGSFVSNIYSTVFEASA
jgi:hypothetical protein